MFKRDGTNALRLPTFNQSSNLSRFSLICMLARVDAAWLKVSFDKFYMNKNVRWLFK